MRRIHVSALAIALVASSLIGLRLRGQGQNAPAVFAPTAGDYETADIRVITPGVVFASGLPDLAAAFTKETGKKVGIVTVGMGTIVEEMTKKTPPPDVIVLPFQLMTTLSLDGGVMPGTFTPLGRTRMGLAVRAGAPKPDISTVEKFAAALKSAKAVMRSNPASRTMVATLIDDVLKRPEFAGVNAPPSTQGRRRPGAGARRRRHGHSDDQPDSSVQGDRAGRPAAERAWGLDRHDGRGIGRATHARRCARVHPVSVAAGIEQGVEAERARTVRIIKFH